MIIEGMMGTKEDFLSASEKVQKLKARPNNEELLQLYGWYKQATVGDATGKRPGFLDIAGRKKFDTWLSCKGMSSDKAMALYIALVGELVLKYGT